MAATITEEVERVWACRLFSWTEEGEARGIEAQWHGLPLVIGRYIDLKGTISVERLPVPVIIDMKERIDRERRFLNWVGGVQGAEKEDWMDAYPAQRLSNFLEVEFAVKEADIFRDDLIFSIGNVGGGLDVRLGELFFITADETQRSLFDRLSLRQKYERGIIFFRVLIDASRNVTGLELSTVWRVSGGGEAITRSEYFFDVGLQYKYEGPGETIGELLEGGTRPQEPTTYSLLGRSRESDAGPIELECHLSFIYFNSIQKRDMGLQEGVEVRVIDYDPVSANDVIGRGTITGSEGRVNIITINKDESNPDVFFEVLTRSRFIELETNRLVTTSERRPDRHYLELPHTWSSRDTYRGYYEDFEGSSIGSDSHPLTFYILESGSILADFNHSNNADLPDSRTRRLVRPGAIVLANLDMSDPKRIPESLPSPLPDRRGELDAKDDVVTDPDLSQLAQMNIHPPPLSARVSHDLVLRLHTADAARVRVFIGSTSGVSTTWTRSFGASTSGSATDEFTLPSGTSDPVRFRIEALTLPGDPNLPAPTATPPLAPEPHPPSGATVGSPVAPERLPNDVWVELVHRDGGTEVSGLRDVALFTIAPYMLLSNLQPTERVYVNYFRDEDHPMVAELIDALGKAFGSSEVTYKTTAAPGGGVWFSPHQPVRPGHADEAKRLYIIDSNLYDDPWVQDEFEVGYCWAPHDWMHVTLHCPRSGNLGLGKFVIHELPSKGMGLFDGFSKRGGNEINHGGNLEVSAPVSDKTGALPEGNAGFAVASHQPAPFGKILLGEGIRYLFNIDSALIDDLNVGGEPSKAIKTEMRLKGEPLLGRSAKIVVRKPGERWLLIAGAVSKKYMVRKEGADLKVYYARVADPDFKDFLSAQKVQPIIGIDTSWLKVAHVDEIISFVPAVTGKHFKMLFASTTIAICLFKKALELHNRDPVKHPLTELFRGKTLSRGVNARKDVSTLLVEDESFNNDVQIQKLSPIKKRLRHCLKLEDDDIIEIPVYFKKVAGPLSADGTAVANTPDMVNLLVVDHHHVIVPKPFGPRMRAADVATILTGIGLAGVTAPALAPLVGHWHWAPQGTKASSIASIYGVDEGAMRKHNTGKFKEGNKVRKNWDKIRIPEDNVDLLEAYVKVVLEEIGLTLHFVDDWYYHLSHGGVHCGTNVKRTPPEAKNGYAGPYWWDHWHP